MKSASILCALLLWWSPAYAEPAEDHWSADLDPAVAANLSIAARMIEAEAYDTALPILRQLSLDAPANADVFNLLGFAQRKTGDLEASARAYERALYLDPDHLGALEYQGELFLTLGDAAAAETNLERLKALCPSPCEETDELADAVSQWRAAQ